ncbi:MAG: hypothetical protein HKN52_09560 [Eudoraea sp.]|nr:hypothetical protein [Eudoraea sp.]
MINFFRKTRKKLADDNKFFKYSRYAIGEILLVVIGILIALQINNWNEDKKTSAYEVKMLGEVRNELIKDTIYFNMIKKRVVSADEGINKIIMYSFQKEPPIDSVLLLMPNLFTGFQYIYHKGAYESIKSVGIDKISNDSVRLLMTDIYDFQLPRTQKFVLENGDLTGPEFMETVKPFINLEMEELPNGFRPSFSFKDSKPFQNNEFMAYLMQRKGSSINSRTRLTDIINQCTKLIKLIDKELGLENLLDNIPTNPYEVVIVDKVTTPGVIYKNGAIGQGLEIGYSDSKGYTDVVKSMKNQLIINYSEGNTWGVAYFRPKQTSMAIKPYADYSMYTSLEIEMKGALGGENVMIGLKDNEDPDDGSEIKFPIELTDNWKYYKIPLDGNFENADLEKLFAAPMFVFGGNEGVTINVRNIRFE